MSAQLTNALIRVRDSLRSANSLSLSFSLKWLTKMRDTNEAPRCRAELILPKLSMQLFKWRSAARLRRRFS
jgi:hypothetical protein